MKIYFQAVALECYQEYHRQVLKSLPGRMNIVKFEDAISDPIKVIQLINQSFEINLEPSDFSLETFEHFMNTQNRYEARRPDVESSFPNQTKEEVKARVSGHIKEHRHFPECQSLYDRLIEYI